MPAPVTPTLANPSASGSDAAASEPKTARRIRRTIGKPVLHAGPKGLLADEVGLDARPVAREELVAELGCEVGELVLGALDPERDDRDGAVGGLAGGALGGGDDLGVPQPLGDPFDALDLRAHAGRRRALALREHDREALALGALEAVEVAVHDLRFGAGDLEPAARQVLGLPGGERRGGGEESDPDAENDEATPLEEGRQLVHGVSHLVATVPVGRPANNSPMWPGHV
jgi:hypothetical protein